MIIATTVAILISHPRKMLIRDKSSSSVKQIEYGRQAGRQRGSEAGMQTERQTD